MTEFINSVNNFISDQNLDKILREENPIYLQSITNVDDAVKIMHLYNYDNVFFDFIKTVNIPECVCTDFDKYYLDDESGSYVYIYDELFPSYADIITDIKSDVPVKLNYGGNVCNIDENLKLYNFLSPFCSKSFNFYFNPLECDMEKQFDYSSNNPTPREFKFSMRCYILNENVKKIFYGLDEIKTTMHVYSNGMINPNY